MESKPLSFGAERRVAGPEGTAVFQELKDSIRIHHCKVDDLDLALREKKINEEQYTQLLKILAKKYEDKEGTDPLTNVFNRTFLNSELNKLKTNLKKPETDKKSKGQSVMLVFLDLNDFKLLNDKHGHPAGDKALIIVTERLKTLTRRTDIIFRYGGDEFTVLMPINDKNPRTCDAIFENLKEKMNGGLAVSGSQGKEIHFSVSMGHSVTNTGEETNEELITKADKEMYLDKKGGGRN